MAHDILPLGDPELDKSRKEFLSPTGYPEDGGIEAVARWQDLEIMKGEATKNQKDAASKGRAFAFERRKRLPYLLSKGLQKPGSVSYEVLRRAANSVHVVRICINVLKEQVTKTKWAIQSKDPLKKTDQKKMDKIEEFFRHPNGSNETLRTLLDKMVEDLLVLDSVTLEKTRYPDGSLAEVHYVDAACYSDDTEVLTKEGWKLFKEVDIKKDLFATRSTETKEFEWQKATDFYDKEWDGDFYNLSSRTLDLLVSPNHRVLYTGNPHDKKNKRYEHIKVAEELFKTVKKPHVPATSHWTGKKIEKFFIKSKTLHHNKKDFTFEDGDDYAAFMGMYLSEGSVCRAKDHEDVITISQMSYSKGYEEFGNLLVKLVGRNPGHDGHGWSWKCKALRDYLFPFGYSYEKFIPDEIMNATQRQQEIFLHYYVLGDGHYRGENFSISTSSKRMADQLQELGQKIGMTASVSKRPWKTSWLRDHFVSTKHQSYKIRFRTSEYQNINVKKTSYTGHIYCVSVPNEILYVRRKGYPIWCGNSVRPVIDDHGNQDIEIPVTDADGKTNTVPVSYVQVVDSNPYGGRESGTVVALWPKKDFIAFNMHPQGSMAYFGYGLSPIEGVLGVVANILNADNYNGSYFEEASFPPMIVHLKGSMGQRELASLRTYLYNELEGKYYRPAIVSGEGEMEVHDLKNDNRRDMQFMEYMKFMATLLSAAYGLSPQDIGLLEDTNRSTSETMKDLSQAKGYGSILSLLEEVFNQEIVWKEFGDKELEFKFVATDTTDPQITSQIHDTYLKAGVMTLNEVREKIGESPYGKWADVPMVLTGTGYAPVIAPDPAEVATDENGDKREDGDEKKSGVDDEEDPKEKKGADKKPEPAKKTLSSYFNKSVFSEDGKYEIFFDDRGVSQPFICYNVITRDGYVVKPPVAVALDSESIEEKWTQKLSDEGLNVVPVMRMSEVDVVNKILETDEIKAEFFKYQNLLNPYDSKKWRQRNGGSRRFEIYLVSKFVDGRNLKDNLLLEDMKRVPKEYTKAIEDLAKIWKAEKKFILGDRRGDQVIITKDKRAMTLDYQFVGNENRWKSTKDAYANALISIPYLHDLFLELTGQKTITEKVRKFFSKKD